jgi:abhydrolase domain-containing protein 14
MAKRRRKSEIKSESVEVRGGKVHFLVAGPTKGQGVILLHGATHSSATWEETGTIQSLAGAGYRVIAVDLPGFGKSAENRGSRLTWVRAFLDAAEIDRPVIVSPSMSGGYSLPLLINEPEGAAGFVAVAPVAIPLYREKLSQIRCPVLALWGEDDGAVPVKNADLLVKAVKHGRKAVIPGARHTPHVSHPEDFQRELLSFLAEIG